ncbi:hypothetical protein SNEBB_003364 [Seison nebaliae]|nr:hypothetical protein SNEBB_003364 [Seison nebaliae]
MKLTIFLIFVFACVALARGGNNKKLDKLLGCPKFSCEKKCREHGHQRSKTDLCRICECLDDPCKKITCPSEYTCSTHFHKSVGACVRSDIRDRYVAAKKMGRGRRNQIENIYFIIYPSSFSQFTQVLKRIYC